MLKLLPRTINHPQLGEMVLLNGISGQTIDTLIQTNALRCIEHDGHRYVIRDELEHYCAAGAEDALDLDAMVEIDGEAIGDPIDGAISAQTAIDEQVFAARTQLAGDVLGVLRAAPVDNAFARTITWPEMWTTVAHVAVNVAGEVEAARMTAAYRKLAAETENNIIDETNFADFHRTLLSLAAPDLERYFSLIWQPGYGRLVSAQEPGAHVAVLSVLRRLVALFSGYRGSPEGSDTPSYVMQDYFRHVRLTERS